MDEEDIKAKLFAIQIEQELDLPTGFFQGLMKEDDWSFVIKLHSLIEAAVTHLLVMKFGKAELSDVFSRLELSNFNTGKLAFVKMLGLLDKEIYVWIQKLSEIRNQFVHDVSNVGTKLDDYFGELEESKRREFEKHFKFGSVQPDLKADQAGEIRMSEVMKLFAQTIFEYSRKAGIWSGAMVVLFSITHRLNEAKVATMREQIRISIVEVMKLLQSPKIDPKESAADLLKETQRLVDEIDEKFKKAAAEKQKPDSAPSEGVPASPGQVS